MNEHILTNTIGQGQNKRSGENGHSGNVFCKGDLKVTDEWETLLHK